MPNAPIITEKSQFTKAKPIDLFNRFYGAFGFFITLSFYTACFKTLHSDTFDTLFGVSTAIVPVWGLFYGAWVARQTWTWCLLTLISIGCLISLGFHLLGHPQMQSEMFVAFGTAEGTCLFWLALTGLKIAKWEDQ